MAEPSAAPPPPAEPRAGLALVQALYSRLAGHARLRHLQLLVALDERGSIARAASQLHLSQPAATQALAELERIIGMRLFERHARGVRATPAGRALLAAARGALSGVRESAAALAALSQGASAALRIGAIPAAAQALVAARLAAFCSARPGVHVDLLEDSGSRLLPMLVAGSLDAVFCRAPEELPAGCQFEALCDDEVVVVAARGHRLAARRGLSLADLHDSRWVVPPAQTQLRQIFDTLVARTSPQALFQVATTSLPVIELLLLQSGVVALVPASLTGVLAAKARLCLLDVAFPGPLPPVGWAFHGAQAPPLLRELIEPGRCGGG